MIGETNSPSATTCCRGVKDPTWHWLNGAPRVIQEPVPRSSNSPPPEGRPAAVSTDDATQGNSVRLDIPRGGILITGDVPPDFERRVMPGVAKERGTRVPEKSQSPSRYPRLRRPLPAAVQEMLAKSPKGVVGGNVDHSLRVMTFGETEKRGKGRTY